MKRGCCQRLGAVILTIVGASGCHSAATGPEAPDSGVASPQLPPRGQVALERWLGARHYLSWRCETMISPPRNGGNHGRQRICANDLVLQTTAGPYPVGASSVKELFDMTDAPNGFAVGIKIEAGDGPGTWYWYERRGTDPAARPKAEGIGVPDCAVCHQLAPHDFVFIRP